MIPADLRSRVEMRTQDFLLRQWARLLAGVLERDGWRRPPTDLEPDARAELAERFELDPLVLDEVLELLASVGFGAPRAVRPRRDRDHGCRREQRLAGVTGLLARSIALRCPTSADQRRSGPVEGRDVWGPVRCSSTMRATDLGVLAVVSGLWRTHAATGEDWVDVSRTELAALVLGLKRPDGWEFTRPGRDFDAASSRLSQAGRFD